MRRKKRHQHWPSVAVRGWCMSRKHSPGGSAGGEREGTSAGLQGRCMNGAGVGGACLAAVRKENERAPVLAFRGGA